MNTFIVKIIFRNNKNLKKIYAENNFKFPTQLRDFRHRNSFLMSNTKESSIYRCMGAFNGLGVSRACFRLNLACLESGLFTVLL
jgi:hypothetical protein